MKWMLVLGVWMVFMGGCRRPLEDDPGPVKVIVEGGGTFPRSLAGRWQANQHGWEFQLEPDGRISEAVISLGRIRVVPGQTTTAPTRSGDKAVFTPGPWTVHYAAATQELTVKITMDHVRVEMAGNILEGSSTDTFVGPISPTDGLWQAQWTTFTQYVARTPDNPSFDMSTNPTYGETKPLTFKRTSDREP